MIGQITAAGLGLIFELELQSGNFPQPAGVPLPAQHRRRYLPHRLHQLHDDHVRRFADHQRLNAILAPFSILAVNVLGVFIKVQSFVFMPVFSSSNAMIPIISYNFGAEKRSRMLKTIRLSIQLSGGRHAGRHPADF